jgi:hypothetical protein
MSYISNGRVIPHNNVSYMVSVKMIMYNITQTDINEENVLASMIFVGCLAGIGLPGNILVLLVFGLKHKPSVYRTIILTLTMYDTLLCGITLPFEMYDMQNKVTFRYGRLHLSPLLTNLLNYYLRRTQSMTL